MIGRRGGTSTGIRITGDFILAPVCHRGASCLLHRLLWADVPPLQLALAACRQVSQGNRAKSRDLCQQRSILQSGASLRLHKVLTKPRRPSLKSLLIEKLSCIRPRWQSSNRLNAQKATTDWQALLFFSALFSQFLFFFIFVCCVLNANNANATLLVGLFA